MSIDLEMHRKVRNKNNTFALVNGMEVIEIALGYAVAKVDITNDHTNPLGSVHGGCILTLADVAGSFACGSHGYWATTLDCTIHYLRAAVRPKTLYATAKEIKAGRKVLVYSVSVTDQDGKELALATISYMSLGEEIPDYTDENASMKLNKYDK